MYTEGSGAPQGGAGAYSAAPDYSSGQASTPTSGYMDLPGVTPTASSGYMDIAAPTDDGEDI